MKFGVEKYELHLILKGLNYKNAFKHCYIQVQLFQSYQYLNNSTADFIGGYSSLSPSGFCIIKYIILIFLQFSFNQICYHN